MVKRSGWCCGWMAAMALAAAPPARAADLLFQAEAQTLAGTCTGEPVRLEGNHNTLSLRGTCGSLLVKGVANTVQITLASRAAIRVEGSQNKVRYASSGTGPAIETFGPGNDVASVTAPQTVTEPAPPAAPAPAPVPALGAAAAKPPPPAKPEAGPLELSGDDQERLADCGGRDVVVTGDRSAYVIRGACRSLTARGDLLTIQAILQPGARIAVTGRGSVVSWAIPGRGHAPVAIVRGPGSRVQRAEAIGGVPIR